MNTTPNETNQPTGRRAGHAHEAADEVWPPRVEHNLQVRWDKGRGAWVLQPWPAHNEDDLEEFDSLRVWAVDDDKDAIIKTGAVLAEFIAEEWNTDRSCELVIRTKDGRIGKGPSGRRTYGRDPETSIG